MGFPGKTTEVGYHSLFQGIFQTQGSNPGFPHWQADSSPLSHMGSPAMYTHYPTIKGKNCLHLHGEEGEEQNGQTTCLRSHSKLGTTLPTNPVPSPLAPTSCFSVQFKSLSHVRLFATPWTAAHQVSLSITNSQSLLKLMSIKLVMPSNHLILRRPLLLLPSIFPSVRVFSNESLHIRWPKYWSFSFSISPSNEYSGLISFWIDWFDLLAVQGTLKSLLQHHSSKASILRCSAFFIVQLSHPYMTIGKTVAFD